MFQRDWRIAFALSLAILSCFLTSRTTVAAQQRVTEKRWVVILVGISGDAEYDLKYRDVANAWQKWFREELQVPAEQVIRPPAPLTSAVIEKTLADVAKQAGAEDSFWLLTLGHGDYDGRHSRFHVPGRDPTEADWPQWIVDVKCREQVVWLTHSSSGWLLKPLSKPGRVVIAATEAAAEVNETEFPYALAKVWKSPAKNCDADGDGRVSLAELFPHVVATTNERFAMDKRVPTEHAQLDDNGDGRGSEELALPDAKDPQAKDGNLSRTIFLPWTVK
jgi:hypothetical protein